MGVWNGIRGKPSYQVFLLAAVVDNGCVQVHRGSTVAEGCILFFCRPCSVTSSATTFSCCSCLPRWPLREFQNALAGRPHSLPLDQLLECVSHFEILPPEVSVVRCCCRRCCRHFRSLCWKSSPESGFAFSWNFNGPVTRPDLSRACRALCVCVALSC